MGEIVVGQLWKLNNSIKMQDDNFLNKDFEIKILPKMIKNQPEEIIAVGKFNEFSGGNIYYLTK
jgi:hypothetical protein